MSKGKSAKPYTGHGDKGISHNIPLLGDVPKTHPCIDFMGSLDEAEAALGLARSVLETFTNDGRIAAQLEWLEELLFRIGFTVFGTRLCINENDVRTVEKNIDRLAEKIRPGFTLNGGHIAAATISVARAIVRRAERDFWRCRPYIEGKANSDALNVAGMLLNRISDLLYMLQREINIAAKIEMKTPQCKYTP